MIMVLGSFTTINYVGDKTLLIAAWIGSFAGTYYAISREKKKAEEKSEI